MHVRVACCWNFLGDNNDDSDDDDDHDDDDDDDGDDDNDDDDDDDSEANGGIDTLDQLVRGFMSGKRNSFTGWTPSQLRIQIWILGTLARYFWKQTY